MRKIIVSIAVLFALMLSLSSCSFDFFGLASDEPTPKELTSDEVLDLIGAKMDESSSYESNMVMDLSYTMKDTKYTFKVKEKTIEDGINSDDYYCYSISEADTYDDSETSGASHIFTLYAYNKGNMFVYNVGSGVEQKLYSAVSKEAFQAQISDEGINLTSLFSEYGSSAVTKNSDGGYTVILSEFQSTAIDDMAWFLFKDSYDLMEAELTDIKVTVNSNADVHNHMHTNIELVGIKIIPLRLNRAYNLFCVQLLALLFLFRLSRFRRLGRFQKRYRAGGKRKDNYQNQKNTCQSFLHINLFSSVFTVIYCRINRH